MENYIGVNRTRRTKQANARMQLLTAEPGLMEPALNVQTPDGSAIGF